MKTKNKISIFLLIGHLSFIYSINTELNPKRVLNASFAKHLRGQSLKIMGTTHLIGTTNINAGSSSTSINIGNIQNDTNFNSAIIQIGNSNPQGDTTLSFQGHSLNINSQAINMGNPSSSIIIYSPFSVQAGNMQNININRDNSISLQGDSIAITSGTITLGSQSTSTELTLNGTVALPTLAAQNNITNNLLALNSTGEVYLLNADNPTFTAPNFSSNLENSSSIYYNSSNDGDYNFPYFLVQLPSLAGNAVCSLDIESFKGIVELAISEYDNYSSRTIKKAIKDLNKKDREGLDEIKFISFECKNNPGKTYLGLIEEQIANIPSMKFAVRFDENGCPIAIDYQSIFVMLFYHLLQRQKELLKIQNKQEKEIHTLKKITHNLQDLLNTVIKNEKF